MRRMVCSERGMKLWEKKKNDGAEGEVEEEKRRSKKVERDGESGGSRQMMREE